MNENTAWMAGKKGLVMGVANDRSLAWGIAKTIAAQGAEICLTFQGPPLEKRVRPLAASIGAPLVLYCDVTDEASVEQVFAAMTAHWGSIDFVVHAIAYADRAAISGDYVDTSREQFIQSLLISCYSFTDLARRAAKIMPNGGSLLTMTYYGAEKVMPHYNIMGVAKAALEASVRYLAADLGKKGIRVNAVSAGPVKTLAATGIGDFRYILKWNELNAPLRKNVTIDHVGNAALYLLSELSSGVTGEIHHVDSGYHVVGMLAPDAVDGAVDLLKTFRTNL
jgi:enoyl-[acyl-carrier protein] reductase I